MVAAAAFTTNDGVQVDQLLDVSRMAQGTMSLEKLPDRFIEHPASVIVITNLYYAEAPWLRPRDVTTRLLAVGMVGTAIAFNLQSHDAFQVLPATWLGVMAVIFILGLVVLGIVLMTSEPEDRRPTPATPPESLEPADADPLEDLDTLSHLLGKLRYPALVNLRIERAPVELRLVHPDPLPDLFYGEELVVRGVGRGGGRRVQVARARLRQWTPRIEERFLAALMATGNVKASLAEAGMSKGSAYAHRERWAGFARRWHEAIAFADMQLTHALLHHAANPFSPAGLPEPDDVEIVAEREAAAAEEAAPAGPGGAAARPLHRLAFDDALHSLHMNQHRHMFFTADLFCLFVCFAKVGIIPTPGSQYFVSLASLLTLESLKHLAYALLCCLILFRNGDPVAIVPHTYKHGHLQHSARIYCFPEKPFAR